MKKVLKKIKDSKGFVSLETIAIAVIILALAAFVMFHFKNTASSASDTANNTISSTVGAANTDATTVSGTYK